MKEIWSVIFCQTVEERNGEKSGLEGLAVTKGAHQSFVMAKEVTQAKLFTLFCSSVSGLPTASSITTFSSSSPFLQALSLSPSLHLFFSTDLSRSKALIRFYHTSPYFFPLLRSSKHFTSTRYFRIRGHNLKVDLVQSPHRVSA